LHFLDNGNELRVTTGTSLHGYDVLSVGVGAIFNAVVLKGMCTKLQPIFYIYIISVFRLLEIAILTHFNPTLDNDEYSYE